MSKEKAALSSGQFKKVAIPAFIIAAIGVGLWIYQMMAGMSVTSMGDVSPWGLYLMAFMFTVGVAVGSMCVAVWPQLWGMDEYKGLSKPAAWVAIVAAILSIGFVLIDLGNPLRVWELFAYSNLGSPLMWDIIALPLFLIVAIIYLVTLVRADSGKSGAKAVRVMSFIALAAAIALCVVDAWIFGLLPGRVAWNTALLVPWFMASAAASGIAVMMLVGSMMTKADPMGLPLGALHKMGRVLAVAVVVDLLCLVAELVSGSYGAHPEVTAQVMGGSIAPIFWIEVAAALIALAMLLGGAGKKSGYFAAASALVLLAVFCKRMQFMMSGFLNMQSAYPGVASSNPAETMLLAAPAYFPSAVEWAVAVAVVALGVGLVAVGLRFIPLALASRQAA